MKSSFVLLVAAVVAISQVAGLAIKPAKEKSKSSTVPTTATPLVQNVTSTTASETEDNGDKSTGRQFSFSVDSFLNDRLKENGSEQSTGASTDEEAKEDKSKATGESSKGRNLQYLHPIRYANHNYGHNYRANYATRPKPHHVSYNTGGVAMTRTNYRYTSPHSYSTQQVYRTSNNNHEQQQQQYYAVPLFVSLDTKQGYPSAKQNVKKLPRLDYNKLVKGYYLEDDDDIEMEPEDSEYETLGVDDNSSSSKKPAKASLLAKVDKLVEKKKEVLSDIVSPKDDQEEPQKQSEPTMQDIYEQSAKIEKAFAEQDTKLADSDKIVDLTESKGSKESNESKDDDGDDLLTRLVDIKSRILKKPDNTAGNRPWSARAAAFKSMPKARAETKPTAKELADDPARKAGEALIENRADPSSATN